MRAARQQMYTCLAVSSDLFLEWIADEESQPQALSDEHTLKHIIELYELAARERISLIMWQRYIDFAAGLANSRDNGIQAAASAAFGRADYLFALLRQGVDATGAHYLQSQALWPQYCDYILREIEQAEGAQRAELVELLQSAFLERLAQPHVGLDDTFARYSEFTTRHCAADYEQQMVEANKIVSSTRVQCTRRDAFEDRLIESDGSWADFSRYIDGLAAEKTTLPRELCMLYERALVTSCYSPDVWSEYIAYLESVAGDKQAALDVTYRALRNCPWSGKLWAQCIHFAYLQQGYKQAAAVFSRATDTHAVSYSMLEFGQLAVAWLTVTRLDAGSDDEALLAACDQCVDTAYAFDISTADPVLFFERCCTATAANVAGGTDRARRLWTRICKARRFCTEAWVLSAEFESAHGSVPSARSVYRHAAQRKLDNPERLFDAWLAFENANGDLPDIYAAERAVNTQRHLIQRRMERATFQADEVHSEAVVPAKRQRLASPEPAVEHGATADLAPQPSNTSDSGHSTIQPPSTTTVFVSGLPSSHSAADLEAFLGGPTSANNIVMLTDKDGEFHGRAKADMLSADALIAALDKNNTIVDGHHISIHLYKQQKRPHKPTETSVAVQGFAVHTKNKQIEAIAKGVGKVVRVRRNPTGDTAFVVMHSYRDAVQAEKALNGCVVDDSTLEATIVKGPASSRTPPVTVPKQQGKKSSAANVTSLAPRNVARRPAKKVSLSDKPQKPVQEPTSTDTVAKSNEEFRRMYLGGDPQS
ncbi:Splicing factor [Coemansia sp. RSA 2618]|nr:Splicing factor [Coemansia sp. RSA 2618]